MPEKYTKVGKRAATRYMLRKRGIPEDVLEEFLDKHEAERKARRYKFPNELTEAECAFIGLFLADGHMAKGGRGIQISSSDRYPAIQAEIERILDACGFDYGVSIKKASKIKSNKPTKYDQKVYRIPVGAIGGQLKRNGYMALEPYLDKNFSELLYGLDRKQTRALIYGLWLGDGNKYGKANNPQSASSSWTIVNTNKQMLERLQILAVLMTDRIYAQIITMSKQVEEIQRYSKMSGATKKCGV